MVNNIIGRGQSTALMWAFTEEGLDYMSPIMKQTFNILS